MPIQHIKNIDAYINYSKLLNKNDKYANIQVNIENRKDDREFTEFLVSIADIVKPQELISIARQETTLSVDDILSKTNEKTSLLAGIKIVHYTWVKLHDYENWEDGYIEGFLRISEKNEPDYFIWTYIRMEHLKDILTTFQNKLVYYGF